MADGTSLVDGTSLSDGTSLPACQFLKTEVRSTGLAIVTINRPDVLNAFNTATGLEIADVFERLGDENSGVRAVVLTAAGDRAFCTGADIKERKALSEDQYARQHLVFEKMFEAVMFCPIPVIVAVNGPAYAGGVEFVAAADFAYAAPHATFAFREIKLGIFPGGGGTQWLPRMIGPKRANEMILSGEPIDAATALSWGLVNRIVDTGHVLDAAIRTGEIICGNGPLAVRQAKKAMRYSLDGDLRTGLIFEREAYHRLIHSEDRLEGIRAANEKRKPQFRGR